MSCADGNTHKHCLVLIRPEMNRLYGRGGSALPGAMAVRSESCGMPLQVRESR